ncbi:MAG: hypothetical protein ABIQ30_01705 [Devosia sp.]
MEIIARVPDPSLARSLVVALRAYGFHPAEAEDGGLPGVTDPFFGKGIPIRVPEEEAEDCRVLAEDLLKEMVQR